MFIIIWRNLNRGKRGSIKGFGIYYGMVEIVFLLKNYLIKVGNWLLKSLSNLIEIFVFMLEVVVGSVYNFWGLEVKDRIVNVL